MANGRNKYQSREHRLTVRLILMEHWDPIGVKGIEDASDEYDVYVDHVYVMMMDEQASANEIADYLFETATNHMGLSNTARLRAVSEQAARMIVARRAEIETH